MLAVEKFATIELRQHGRHVAGGELVATASVVDVDRARVGFESRHRDGTGDLVPGFVVALVDHEFNLKAGVECAHGIVERSFALLDSREVSKRKVIGR